MYTTDETFPDQQAGSTERFETDTQKLVHRHLRDKDHIITEEELKSIRVGMAPPSENTEEGELNEEGDDGSGKEAQPADAPLTPWDAVEPQST